MVARGGKLCLPKPLTGWKADHISPGNDLQTMPIELQLSDSNRGEVGGDNGGQGGKGFLQQL